jgi:AbrB family looped-hinge helix DNA binding protein
MKIATLSVKGQIVVPAKIRTKFGLKKGSRVAIIEEPGGFSVRPVERAYFEQYAGLLPGKGKATKALLKDRRKERAREDAGAR